MDVVALLAEASRAGLTVSADGEKLMVRGPRSAEPLATLLLARKAEVLSLLRGTPAVSSEHVGRHGEPYPVCGDTWQWPTTAGLWVCSWCFVGNPQTAPRCSRAGRWLPQTEDA
jgi:hypothetical protein